MSRERSHEMKKRACGMSGRKPFFIWIALDDKLWRRARAFYDEGRLREHLSELAVSALEAEIRQLEEEYKK